MEEREEKLNVIDGRAGALNREETLSKQTKIFFSKMNSIKLGI